MRATARQMLELEHGPDHCNPKRARSQVNARSGNTVAMTWTLRSITTACGAAVPALAWKTGQLAVLTSAVF